MFGFLYNNVQDVQAVEGKEVMFTTLRSHDLLLPSSGPVAWHLLIILTLCFYCQISSFSPFPEPPAQQLPSLITLAHPENPGEFVGLGYGHPWEHHSAYYSKDL